MLELADAVEGSVIRLGAEALVKEAFWRGVKLVIKQRLPKRYRSPYMDSRIRRSRTLHEARTIKVLSEKGVPVPLVLFLDLKNYAIYMQRIMGFELRLVSNPLEYAASLGQAVGLMHKHDISHGDLTLSNIIVDGRGGLWLVDFGLSMFNADLEEKAVDIHLLERSAANSFPNIVKNFMEAFFEGYKQVVGEDFLRQIVNKVYEIRSRGRYVER